MHPVTTIFAKLRYSLAALLLTTIVTTGVHASDSTLENLDALDGLGFSDGTEAIKKSETLAAEPLVENAWNFEDPDSIPGFGSMPPSVPTGK